MQNEKLILLDGDWLPWPEYVTALLCRGCALCLTEGGGEEARLGGSCRPVGMVAALGLDNHVARITSKARELGLPWIAWDRYGLSARVAYQGGAVAVLPPDTTPDELADVVARSMLDPEIAGMNPAEEKGRRQFRSNEIIPSGDFLVVELKSGVVGMRALQEDGTVVLMGLFGPGDVIATKAQDLCYIELFAHEEAEVSVRAWWEVANSSGLARRLRDSMTWLMAWSAMQTRPQVEDRLRGILALAAQRFGERQGDWWDLGGVRMTHQQLATAVCATRPTVTRALIEMERRGLIRQHGVGNYRRILLRAEPKSGEPPPPAMRS